MSTMLDLADLWPRMDERPATVKRVTGQLVSVTFGGFTEPATFRRGPEAAAELFTVGASIAVAGRNHYSSFAVWAVEISGQRFWVDRAAALKALAPPSSAPTSPPSFLAVLVKYGLLDDVASVPPHLYGHDAQMLLVSLYEPRGALARGLVHYDHKWRNDTKDPVADLAMIVRRSELRAIRIGRNGFRVSFDRLAHEVIDAGDLEELASAIDSWLARERSEVRLFSWVTGDHHVFLARPLEQGLALARELDDPHLEPSSIAAAPGTGDDFF